MLLTIVVFLILPLFWIAAAGFNVYRLARFFQLEGYDSKRYLLWLSRQRGEMVYIVVNLVGFIIIGVLAVNASLGAYGALLYGVPLLVAVFLIGVYNAVWIIGKLRGQPIKQKYAPTPRANRLLVTAILSALILSALIIALILVVSHTGLDALIVAYLFVGGPLAMVCTAFALPLANQINWPIEESFRQYYLRKAKRHLKASGATVIAITGSYGKTTTKHYLNHILEGRFRVLMTPKSYNTLLGISRVINDILANDMSYEYFIVETDAYFVGENVRICQLVEPKIGIVMTVGPMHLERLGSMANITAAQYEVIEALPEDGLGVFNGDDAEVYKMSRRNYPQQRIVVSQNTQPDAPHARITTSNIKMTSDGLDFDVNDAQTHDSRAMHAPLYGEHNVTNILMATAVARHLGMSLPEIAARVATLQPAEHRLIRRVMPDGTIMIDDTYSANPVGTKTALGVLGLERARPDTRRVVVSSGMFELGDLYEEENRKLGQRIADVATDVILIGAGQTRPVSEGLDNSRFPKDHVHVVGAFDEAVRIYKEILRPGDALLMLTDLPDTYA